MDLNIRIDARDGTKVVTLDGELDSLSAPRAYEQVSRSVQPGERVLLDMSAVRYMSSAGIRTLLLLYRQIIDSDGRVVLVGLNDDLADTLQITGFLEFFTTTPSLDVGLRALHAPA